MAQKIPSSVTQAASGVSRKLSLIFPREYVDEVWSHLTQAAGWSEEGRVERQEEFFRLALEKAAKKPENVDFPSNYVSSRNYKTNVGRFMVIAHFSPEAQMDGVCLKLVYMGAYFKVWETAKDLPETYRSDNTLGMTWGGI